MNTQQIKIGNVMLTLLSALVMLALIVAVLPLGEVSAKLEAAPQGTLRIVKQVTLYSGNGITTSATGSAVRTTGYSNADCYSIVDVTSAQTVTAIISHSADAQNWVTLHTFSAVSADGTSFTPTLTYGEYLRVTVNLGGSNAVTPTVRCVLKDHTD